MGNDSNYLSFYNALQFEEGLAMLFFEVTKHINKHFHSITEPIYKLLLAKISNDEVSCYYDLACCLFLHCRPPQQIILSRG